MKAWPRALSVSLVTLAAWGLLQSASAVSAADKKESPAFNAKFFGEGGQTPPNTPDQTDYQNTSSMGSPSAGPGPTALPSVDAAAPAVRPPAQAAAAQARGAAADAPAYGVVMPAQGRSETRPWPGRKRSAETPAAEPAAAASADGSVSAAPADGETLRDAPNAMRYSLWNGLSAPMLLPAARAAQVTPDQAKNLGRMDYESHILGAGAAAGAGTVDGPSVGSFEPRASEPASEGLFVSVDLDVSAHPGDYRDAVAEIGVRSGLRLDGRFPPAFVDAAKTKVTVRGWVPAERLGEVFGPDVQRLRVERSPFVRTLPDAPTTDLLVGIRIPPGISPSAALPPVIERLSRYAGFRLRRVIGYQAIPGTSQMVAVVSARVPVPDIVRVLKDPAVIKIVPSPDAAPVVEEAPAPLMRGFIDYAASRRPLFLIGTLVLTVLVFGTLFLHRRSR
ncbi:MAG: hypothetical protein WC969_12485 [Elusimicrobiota bacterium]|jgi:hypothetical protein